jgi:hypothetical protein
MKYIVAHAGIAEQVVSKPEPEPNQYTSNRQFPSPLVTVVTVTKYREFCTVILSNIIYVKNRTTYG